MNMLRPYTYKYEAHACSPKGYMHVSRARCTDEGDAPRRSRGRGALSRALGRGTLPQINLFTRANLGNLVLAEFRT